MFSPIVPSPVINLHAVDAHWKRCWAYSTSSWHHSLFGHKQSSSVYWWSEWWMNHSMSSLTIPSGTSPKCLQNTHGSQTSALRISFSGWVVMRKQRFIRKVHSVTFSPSIIHLDPYDFSIDSSSLTLCSSLYFFLLSISPLTHHCLLLLHGLCNLISSSAHSSVVQGHIELLRVSWRVTVSKGLQVLSFNSYQEGRLAFLWSSWRVTVSEGLQVLSFNSYQEGLPLWRMTARVTSLGETLVEQLSKKAADLGGWPHHSWWGLGTSGSPRWETRLLGRLYVELAKDRGNTWVGLYTSPQGTFLSERTIGEWIRKVL